MREALPLAGAIAAGVGLALAFTHYSGNALPWGAPQAVAKDSAASHDVWFEQGRPRAETLAFLAMLEKADEHGLDPVDYRTPDIAQALAAPGPHPPHASALLSEALAAYARDLKVPRGVEDVVYIDPELRPAPPDPAELVASGSLTANLRALHAQNLPYENLRAGLKLYRESWGRLPEVALPEGPSLAVGSKGERVLRLRERLGLPADGEQAQIFDAALGEHVRRFRADHGLAARPLADAATIAALNRGAAHYERLIIADLDRLRGLPSGGERYVLVDTASAELRLIENGREAGSMRAVVGKRGMETPQLAGFIRYAVVNPYWNVPPDLVRNSVAPAVLREGHEAIARRRFVLSPDWRSDTRIDPEAVDWPAVAAGRKSIWVRQLPGGSNMMGKVKFMLPNDLGIYLHDTPNKSLFRRDDRQLSSGCVRVEDADRLAGWLLRRERVLDEYRGTDERVDLAEPVPVFITRLGTTLENGRIRFRSGSMAPAQPPASIARTR